MSSSSNRRPGIKRKIDFQRMKRLEYQQRKNRSTPAKPSHSNPYSLFSAPPREEVKAVSPQIMVQEAADSHKDKSPGIVEQVGQLLRRTASTGLAAVRDTISNPMVIIPIALSGVMQQAAAGSSDDCYGNYNCGIWHLMINATTVIAFCINTHIDACPSDKVFNGAGLIRVSKQRLSDARIVDHSNCFNPVNLFALAPAAHLPNVLEQQAIKSVIEQYYCSDSAFRSTIGILVGILLALSAALGVTYCCTERRVVEVRPAYGLSFFLPISVLSDRERNEYVTQITGTLSLPQDTIQRGSISISGDQKITFTILPRGLLGAAGGRQFEEKLSQVADRPASEVMQKNRDGSVRVNLPISLLQRLDRVVEVKNYGLPPPQDGRKEGEVYIPLLPMSR